MQSDIRFRVGDTVTIRSYDSMKEMYPVVAKGTDSEYVMTPDGVSFTNKMKYLEGRSGVIKQTSMDGIRLYFENGIQEHWVITQSMVTSIVPSRELPKKAMQESDRDFHQFLILLGFNNE